mmetsp:Transcript_22466/g.42098  ORF Transcript_22466/g.42098 Transcript_22466/m.42098 type:complete len:543 (-) Transcript_22466:90-1718(-)
MSTTSSPDEHDVVNQTKDVILAEDDENLDEEVMSQQDMEEVAKKTCWHQYASLFVVIAAIIGLLIGYGFSQWDVSDDADAKKAKSIAVLWIGLFGDLFIRMLKAVVLPLVFVNVIMATVDMLGLGQAGKVGKLTFLVYLLTTFFAALFGLLFTLIFKSKYNTKEESPEPSRVFSLNCPLDGLLVQNENNLECMSTEDIETELVTADSSIETFTQFGLNDISKSFVATETGSVIEKSLSDTLYEGIFLKIVTQNIVGSFVTSDFAAIVAFAIVFGVALYKTMTKRGETVQNPGSLLMMFKELDEVLLKLINWIIALTPIAIVSLIVKAVGNRDLASVFSDVGWLVLTTMTGMLAHFLFTHIVMFYFITRRNPFGYFKFIVPAQLMAFASASSAATLPVTMNCVQNSGEVPSTLKRFVLSLGATINMDGSALYFPAAITFLAVSEGISLDVGQFVLIILISTIGSAGTAPVPSASLVLILTAFQTVTGLDFEPDAFALILAVDFFQDRLRTVLNVTGDASVARMVASLSGSVPEKKDTSKLEEA